ncbi:MAG: aminomethyl-transferring glycine dehydrogenase subunit GcvPA [Candidatus Wallbacteria bacterium]|nr:aminomethyl-transferring glycine dehydrogenase subunit GcvPA [Candidatus Wallbacteria bacterium]
MAYIPLTASDREQMLRKIGVASVDELFSDIPEDLRLKSFDWLPPSDERETLSILKGLAEANRAAAEAPCFLGAGAYDHYIPAAVDAICSRSEFYTAYTPYQPEVSQGTLQAIFEFQSLICALTGLAVSNASMYDGPSALGEAVLIASSYTKKQKVLYAESLSPVYLAVVRTYLESGSIELIPVKTARDGRVDPSDLSSKLSADTACLVLQNPNFFGVIEDGAALKKILGPTMLVVCADPNSLGLLAPPGSYGASICVGDCQPLGLPMSFGGPYAGYLAVSNDLMRKLPGRIVGRTVDCDGKTGFVLTLQTREQHIKREKATSNICSNQALCALRSTIYICLLGKTGLKNVSCACLDKAHRMAEAACKNKGFSLRYTSPFYKEFVLDCPSNAAKLAEEVFNRFGILAGVPLSRFNPQDSNGLLISVTEKRTGDEIVGLSAALAQVAGGLK